VLVSDGLYDHRMRVEILGSGGAATIPRPGCHCRVCVEARDKDGRFARTGPSTFVHGPDILFDTPEESKFQLERACIGDIAACFYSHWHPDHTMGRRVWETRNGDFRTWPREAKQPLVTDVYLPEQVAKDFRIWLGGMAHLEFMRDRGWIRIHELEDGQAVEIGGVTVRPFRLAEDYVYAFELSDGERRLLVAMDELNGWSPPSEVRGCDLAVLPMGICEFDVFTGERVIHEEHPVLEVEATFEETLAIVTQLDAHQVVLSHVEEMDCNSYDDLLQVEQRLQAEGTNISFAWDGRTIDV
jgi:phosphoribosyl 1,2-cyclic phosphate phosphodiesterase